MPHTNYKQEYIENFDEIESLYGTGMTLGHIHEKLVTEGKVTSPVEHFKNMHSQITIKNIAGLRQALEKKSQHEFDFFLVKDCIPELLKTGLTYEKIYTALRKSDKIKMSVSLFRTLGVRTGVYKPREVIGDAVRPTEVEFLERKEEIVKSMAEGKKASKVYKEMYEAEKLNMSFYTFRNYCMKHGVEMLKRDKK